MFPDSFSAIGRSTRRQVREQVSVAVLLILAITGFVELWHFGFPSPLPSGVAEVFMFLGGLVWLVSPLLTLALLARANSLRAPQKAISLVGAVLSAAIASFIVLSRSGQEAAGLEPLVLPALQWLVVFAILVWARSLHRSRSVGART